MVTGAAKTKKKSEARRFLNIFAPDDAENVKSSILSDVIVPGVKAAIADVISIVLFGDTGRIGSRKSGGSRIAYQKYYDDRRDDRREYGRPRAAVGFEYDDIIFETRGDADLVLDQLESAIAKYEVASVADLYDLAGVTCRNYTANRYGWSDIQSAKVVRTSEGYVIRLPRAVQINYRHLYPAERHVVGRHHREEDGKLDHWPGQPGGGAQAERGAEVRRQPQDPVLGQQL